MSSGVSGHSYLKKSRGYYVIQAINYTLLLGLGLITLYPFWYAFVLAFNDGNDAMRGGIYIWPRIFSLDNFQVAFRNRLIRPAFTISISRTALAIIIGVTMQAMMAYALTKRDLPGRSGIIFFFYFTTLFGGGLAPTYILYRQIGLLNNFWVYVIPGIFSFFNAIILRTAFYSVPDSLSESARIDGASEFRIFFQIIIPLSLPTIATIALFIGVGNWNDWFTGQYFVPNKKLWPAATLLNDLMNTFQQSATATTTGGQAQVNEALAGGQARVTAESVKMAFLVILTMPIIVIYPFVQKYFVKGVMIGSIKE
ncbi:MAG: carbohydrate ABC transporter permease [Bacillota bacterium]|nr:carbohydrate ABC transporter permease [Bacillota bacterium]